MTHFVEVPSVAVRLTPMRADEVTQLMVSEPVGEPTLVLNHNLHSLYLFHRLPWFRRFYDRGRFVLVDGWPILKLLDRSGNGRFGHEYRIGSTDWLDMLRSMPLAEEFRVFVLGGTPDTAERACDRLRSGSGRITAAGRSGYFDLNTQSDEVLAEICRFRPHLLLVGMGMPRQEKFIDDNFDDLPAAYIATVGGAVDYLAGAQRLAPRSFGKLGMEWLWRLGNDPGRLWHRYLVEPLQLAALVMRHRARKTGAWEVTPDDARR